MPNSEDHRTTADAVQRVLEKFEELLTNGSFKPSVGDYVKLLQFQKEHGAETPQTRGMDVTWIEPTIEPEEEVNHDIYEE